MANDFSKLPTWVHVEEPEFNIVVSKSENMKKDRQIISSNAIYRFRLVFTGIDDTAMNTIWEHYIAVKGSYTSFLWKNTYIPTILKTLLDITSEDITMRWIEGSFQPTIRPHGFDLEIRAEREIT
jgi:hypothetical protein